MSLDQPLLLWGLLAVPALLGAYIWQTRRRQRGAVRYSDVALVRAAVGSQRAWRRHVPIALVLASLAMLGVAAARPQVRADVPLSGATVILALDVSGSMCSTDVDPNRLTAAQAAVRTFVERQGDSTKIGLVVFSGFAQLAVAPTTNRSDLLSTLDAVTTGRGTSIGAAILKSIDAIAEIDPNVAPSDTQDGPSSDGLAPGSRPAPSQGGSGAGGASPPGRSGSPSGGSAQTAPEVVVLLTDGANTRGISPEDAALQAAARGVQVYPIGFGTKNPLQLVCTRSQLGGGPQSWLGGRGGAGGFGGGAGGGPGGLGGIRSFLIVDEEALKTVARATGGEYFPATDADQLQRVLTDLPRYVTTQQQDVEVSAAFVAVAALLLLLGLGLSVRWATLSR